MSLTGKWSPFFSPSVRMRGRACHREGRVEQLPTENGEVVNACVRADREYTVMLSTEEPGAEASCTCSDYSDDGHYCEHIWAVLMEVDEKGVAVTEAETASLAKPGWPKAAKARKRDRSVEETSKSDTEWQDRLTLLRQPMMRDAESASGLPGQASVSYVVQSRMSERCGGLVVELMHRQPTRSGWSRFKAFKLNPLSVRELADPIDRELCALVMGGTTVQEEGMDYRFARDRSASAYRLPTGASYALLKQMVDTGRCYLGGDELEDDEQIIESGAAPLRWDEGEPWKLWVVGLEGIDGLEITVELRRPAEAKETEEGQEKLGEDVTAISVADPDIVLGNEGGVVIHEGVITRLEDHGAYDWVHHFREDMPERGRLSPIKVPQDDVEVFLERMYLLPCLPELDFPEGVCWPEKEAPLRGHLDMYSPGKDTGDGVSSRTAVTARVWFEYDGHRVDPGAPGRFVPRGMRREELDEGEEEVEVEGEVAAEGEETATEAAETPVEETVEATEEWPVTTELVRRDRAGEERMLGQLLRSGFKSMAGGGSGTLQLPVKLMPIVANELIGSRWIVKADQKMIRGAGTPSLSIMSGVDWFELRGGVKYETSEGTQTVPLPEILAAAREGRRLVTLGDGTQGMLPEEWLRRHNLLTAIGEASEDGLRFKLSQAALLDALLDTREVEDVDSKFEEIRKRLREFEGVKSVDAAPTFGGDLRQYQREGLGWMGFLNWFGMGGILADDMGLGKTVQVLALLDKRIKTRAAGGPEAEALGEARPTLVVAPKSVVFNWIDEAKHFTPDMRVLNYAGAEREALREQFKDTDMIVTSYGLLRRDIAILKDVDFDYAILDEAQVIKNPSSQSAKAARLLRTQHRLALTGTPVENHMGDLWSIFEFANPGMLGSNVRFGELLRGGVQDPSNLDAARQVGAALRPFILRRTKGQVLTELPEKTEQTIVCELDTAQRKIYDNLREHYRGTLLNKIDAARGSGSKGGVGGNAMMVLEALLRLRQAACHPGLIDAKYAEGPSAKLDALMEQLRELNEEGHKALVFSQFTSMLSLVKQRLDKEGLRYEYLDGKTRNRKERVERFQNDPECPLFLISLKAGGLGLNLTAAQYVFILDPWWNPAVEAQAIDRAHRIGQESHVTAYRLICQDTVEQRIAELQDKKRKLADAIVGGEENLLRTLTRDELDRLLS